MIEDIRVRTQQGSPGQQASCLKNIWLSGEGEMFSRGLSRQEAQEGPTGKHRCGEPQNPQNWAEYIIIVGGDFPVSTGSWSKVQNYLWLPR